MCDQRHNDLIAYIDGALSADARRTIESHLVFCSECNQRLGALEAESTMMQSGLRMLTLPQPKMSTEELIAQLRNPSAVGLKPARSSADRRWREKARARIERIPSPFEVGAAGLRKLEALMSALGDYKTVVAVAGSLCVLMMVTAMVCRIFESKKGFDEQARSSLDKHAKELRALKQDQDLALTTISTLKEELERERMRADQRLADVIKANQTVNADRDKLTQSLKVQRETSRQLATHLRNIGDELMVDANGDPVKTVRLNSDQATEVSWESPQQFLTPTTVRSAGARNIGWVVKLNQTLSHFVNASMPAEAQHNMNDSSRTRQNWNNLISMKTLGNCGTVAAPAAAGGKIIVGDGFSGTRLVALREDSGQQVWALNGGDNGMGSPVLSEDGALIACTSESCTLYVTETNTGKKLWTAVLASTVLSHPTISKDRIFVVHPNNGTIRYMSGTDSTTGPSSITLNVTGPYAFTCFDLRTGALRWTVGIDSDAITAPVANDDTVYVATRNGTIAAYSVAAGKKFWAQDVCATCAPVVRDGSVYFSSWRNDPKFGFTESLMSFSTKGQKEVFERLAGPYPATYMLPLSLSDSVLKHLEESPFEDDFEPAMAKEMVKLDLPPTPTFPCNWNAYGPRPAIVGNDAFATIGDHIVCADVHSGRTKWSSRVIGRSDDAYSIGSGQPPLTPAAVADGKLYIGSAWGDVLCVDGTDGKVLWRYRLPHTQGISSEIVLDKGRAFAVTKNGLLFGLDTGDENATGWAMAGGSPGRNGGIISKKD